MIFAPLKKRSHRWLTIGLLAILAFIGLRLVLPKPVPLPESDLTKLTAEDWREDLRFLTQELTSRHKNAFSRITKDSFIQASAQLERDLPELKPFEITTRMAQLVASIGDAHTMLSQPSSIGNLPLQFYCFSDGVYVIGASSEYVHLLGARLVAIGATETNQVIERLGTLIAHENEALLKGSFPNYLRKPRILEALGVFQNAERGSYRFIDRNGKELVAELAPMPPGKTIEWRGVLTSAGVTPALYQRNSDRAYWYEYLPESKTLYFKYNSCSGLYRFYRFNSEMWRFIDSHEVDRLVVDLRDNGGGNSMVLWAFTRSLKQHPQINQPGHLFVVLGRATFSSAILNAIELKQETSAIFIGEPTGGKPNHFGEVKWFQLPNSHLTVRYSSKYFKNVADDPSSLIPDEVITITSQDYLAGRDPVLERILSDKQKATGNN